MGNCNKTIVQENEEKNVHKIKEKEARKILLFLIGKSMEIRSTELKSNISKELETYRQNLNVHNDSEIEVLNQMEKLYKEMLKKSFDRFNELKINSYGIFDPSSNLLEVSKKVVIGFYINKLINSLKFREKLISISPQYFDCLKEIKINNDDPNIYGTKDNFFLNENSQNEQKIDNLLRELFNYIQPSNNEILSLFTYKNNESSKISKSFERLMNNYLYFYLKWKGNYTTVSQDTYIRLSKMKRYEIYAIIKKRSLNDIIEEDYNFSLDYVNNLININSLSKKKSSFKKGEGVIERNFLKKISAQNNESIKIYGKNNIESHKNSFNVVEIPKQGNLKRAMKSMFIGKNGNYQKRDSVSSTGDNSVSFNKILEKNREVYKKGKKVIEKNKINSIKGLAISQSHYYKGALDTLNFNYVGIGYLGKPHLSIYNGSFRDGKKCGYGYLFMSDLKNDEIYYLIGEFQDGKLDGYGIQYIFPKDSNKSFVFKRGKFLKGEFKKGIITSFKYSLNNVDVEYYFGQIVENSYVNGCKLHRIRYKYSNNIIQEAEYYYFYKGDFENNLEHGKGLAVKSYPSLYYQSLYRGDFSSGDMEGEGVILFEGKFYIKKYEGFFEKNRWFCKYGRVYFASGDIYEGFFDSSNFKSTVGTYLHSTMNKIKFDNSSNSQNEKTRKFNEIQEISHIDFAILEESYSKNFTVGDVYFGEFTNDKKHGIGKYIFNSKGLLAYGHYIDGERNGIFETVRIRTLVHDSEDNVSIGSTGKKSKRKKSLIFRNLAVKKEKIFYLFENDEIIDNSDKPFTN